MQVINLNNTIENGLFGSVLAIGNFDGVHKGHAQIVKKVILQSQKLKKPSGILTFNPSPIEFFIKERNFHLTSFEQKSDILSTMGLNFLAYAEFNEEFSQISAEDFVRTILVEKLKVSYVFTGEDFKFGNKAKGQGDGALLSKLAHKYNFGYCAVEKILNEDNERYSSTKARVAISNGDPKKAEQILGRKFEITGKVIEGQKIASSKLGFPTANISIDGYQTPKFGVYKCTVELGGTSYKAIANIGIKPTLSGASPTPLLEVHIPEYKGANFYGKNISVKLEDFVREEIKFSNLEELKEQIKKDIKNAC